MGWAESDTERGSVTAELAVVTPVLMLLIVGVLQFGLWYHAQHVVQTAALEASRMIAAEGGDAQEGKTRAVQVVESGVGSATRPSVDVVVSEDAVTVRVEAEMSGLLPLPGLGVIELKSQASSYLEEFRPAEDVG